MGYSSHGKTARGVWDAHIERMQSAQVMTAVDAFFVPAGAGTCPVWTVPGNDFHGPLTFDVCAGEFTTVWQVAGWVILAVCAFFCVRVAIE